MRDASSAVCAATAASAVFFCNKNDCVIGDREGLTLELGDSYEPTAGTTYSAFGRDEAVVKATQRCDFGLADTNGVFNLTTVTWA